jgi:hypothetical protein
MYNVFVQRQADTCRLPSTEDKTHNLSRAPQAREAAKRLEEDVSPGRLSRRETWRPENAVEIQDFRRPPNVW